MDIGSLIRVHKLIFRNVHRKPKISAKIERSKDEKMAAMSGRQFGLEELNLRLVVQKAATVSFAVPG
jgi:hypothetical protein